MRYTHIRKTDLNLLLPALVLLEERQVSQAAARYHLSQPAMSRALQRLRELFGDDLLVRGKQGFSLTHRGQDVLRELAELLPRLDALLRSGSFDAARAEESFRIACTDYAINILGPHLFGRVLHEAPGVSLDIVGWHGNAFDDLERGRLDLVLWPQAVPQGLETEVLFEDDFVCVLCKQHPGAGPTISLDHYLRYPHVVVNVLGGQQTVVEQRLQQAGLHRKTGLRVPYFGAAVAMLPGTPLILTLPRRFARRYQADAKLCLAEAPLQLAKMAYLMAWHPRSGQDLASQWLRAAVRSAAQDAVASSA